MIRTATQKDIDDILNIHRLAFNEEDEAALVTNLLNDPSAQPCLSLMAVQDDQPIGHILFTKAHIEGTDLNAALLAPLAVHPDFHFKGTGQRLIKDGLKRLQKEGCDLVFVLGDPAYYPRCGFQTDAARHGYPTPVAIPAKWAQAWMFIKLHDCRETGTVQVADRIAAPEYWSD